MINGKNLFIQNLNSMEMNLIDRQLQKIQKENRIGLMTHVIAGYPTLSETEALIQTLVRGGSDFVEIQIPFSDPIADGPTIMRASDSALQNGTTVHDAIELMKRSSSLVSVPLLFMCYFNTVHAYGVHAFCEAAAAAGASGLIIPDVPPEEDSREELTQAAQKQNLHLIRVVSPASSAERIQKNAALASGFIYCVSRYGVTGTTQKLAPQLDEYLDRVRSATPLPRAVGFGISSNNHVQALTGKAEIAVVGSAIVALVEQGKSQSDIETFIRNLTV